MDRWPDDERTAYGLLKTLDWLPSDRDSSRWYRPEELFAVFRSYLFETQASILAFPTLMQSQSAKLIAFLGIKQEPQPSLVVRHLLHCSEHGIAINDQVYSFLNDRLEDRAVAILAAEKCVRLDDNRYVRPDQVFRDEHPFGRFRFLLPDRLRQFDALWTHLGIRAHARTNDFIQVLKELASEYGKTNLPLDEEAYRVIMRCWAGLSAALLEGEEIEEQLASFGTTRVIPDTARVLQRPRYLFFKDRGDLAMRFGEEFSERVIIRPQGAWQGMEAAGVRFLRQAVTLRFVDTLEVADDTWLVSRFQERRPLLARVLESEATQDLIAGHTTLLDDLVVQRSSNLLAIYILEAGEKRYFTSAEQLQAVMAPDESDRPEKRLLVAYRQSDVSWASLARELAYALVRGAEIGGLAGGIKEAISATTYDEAERTLDDLGYPPLQQWAGADEMVVRKATEEEHTDAVAGDIDSNVFVDGEDDLKGAQLSGTESTSEPANSATPNGAAYRVEGDTTPSTFDHSNETPSADPAIQHVSQRDNRITAGKVTADDDQSTKGDRNKKKTTKAAPNRKNGRFISYVYVEPGMDDPKKDDGSDLAEKRSEVDLAGIERVVARELARGRAVSRKPHHQIGYDLESTEQTGTVRFIEVKSLGGYWSEQYPAAVSRAQFSMAQKYGDAYWLYVVERATSDDFQVYPIQNPAGQVGKYLFDYGWHHVVVDESVDDDVVDATVTTM